MAKKTAKAAGKVMGTAKKAGQMLHGRAGIFQKLSEEHGEVDALMKRCAASQDPAVREELFVEIKKQLLSHAKGEEREFYSVLKKHTETRELAEHAIDEHHEVEQTLEQLGRMDFGSDEWAETFEELMDDVKEHVEEEEKDLFPKAEHVLDADRAKEIEKRYLTEKKRVMEQMAKAAE